jgi:cadmium resistance protein CadD (predicted permease)
LQLILMIFFSTHRFHVYDIVLGQYLGIGSLIAISALGSILALVIPLYVIGLMGLVPIAIGIISWGSNHPCYDIYDNDRIMVSCGILPCKSSTNIK